MKYSIVSEDAFAELSILQEKAATALYCIPEYCRNPRVQSLADIANDYVVEMGNAVQVMQENAM